MSLHNLAGLTAPRLGQGLSNASWLSGTIIYFRRLAYLTFEKSKQLETAKVAEPAKGSWLSLSSWTGGQHGHPTVADLDFDNMFSDDDMDQMNTLFQEHRKALEAAAQ